MLWKDSYNQLDLDELTLIGYRPIAGGGGGPGMTGPGGGGGKTGTPGAPQGPQAPNAFQQSLDQFNTALPGIQSGILANQGTMGGIASALGGLAGGGAWNQFTQQQLGQFNTMANAQQQAALGQLSRQGITGSGASNTLNQQLSQINSQRQALTGQLGQAGLQFQAGALGMQEGALGQQNQMGNEYLQNYLANPAMQVGYTAAQNMGNLPGGKYGGGGKK